MPYEIWWRRKPRITHLRVFGSAANFHVHKQKLMHTKLSNRAEKGIFVGYSDEAKAYRILLPSTHQVVISWSVVFLEDDKLVTANHAQCPKQTLLSGDDGTSEHFELDSSRTSLVPLLRPPLSATLETSTDEGENENNDVVKEPNSKMTEFRSTTPTEINVDVLEVDIDSDFDAGIDLEDDQHVLEAEPEREKTPPLRRSMRSRDCVAGASF